MVQLACAATLVPQLLLCAKSPATAILVMLSTCPPLLVRVTIWLGVAPPRMMLPKPIVVTERRNTGRGANVPLPLKLTALTVAAFWALLVMLICAVLAPVLVGLKLRARLQLPATAMLVQPLCPVSVKLVAFVPVSVIALMVRVAVPVLVMVTLRVLLAVLMINSATHWLRRAI